METTELQQLTYAVGNFISNFNGSDFAQSVKSEWETYENLFRTCEFEDLGKSYLEESVLGRLSRVRLNPGEKAIAYEVNSEDLNLYASILDETLKRNANYFTLDSDTMGHSYLVTSAGNSCVVGLIEKKYQVNHYSQTGISSSAVMAVKKVYKDVKGTINNKIKLMEKNRAQNIAMEPEKKRNMLYPMKR